MTQAADLDVDTEIQEILELPEAEVLSEFARIMHEWGHAPFRRGEVTFPTLQEARDALAKSPYNQG